MTTVNILNIHRMSADDRDKIEAVSPSIRLTDAGGWFDGEIRDTWPAFTSERYLSPDAKGSGTRDERDALLADADIVLGGWPFPLDLRSRTPKLKWFHQRPAGASNLRLGDLWGSDVIVTTSRGFGNTLPIAEYALACILYFAKGLHRVAIDRQGRSFDHRAYAPILLEGKTACIVGVGGIGRDVGRLCAGAGMRVIGTKQTPPASAADLPEGFAEIRTPGDLVSILAESDVVVICCQWTAETTDLINRETLAAMKPGAILVNVARGEIIDEEAVAEALEAGHLRGVGLDVYVGEFERPPSERLWADPRVLITPHTSGGTDENRHRAIEVFCRNLDAFVQGRPMENVVDWERGY